MKKGKILVALILSAIISLGCVAPAAVSAQTITTASPKKAVSGKWKTVGSKKYFVLSSGKHKKGWLQWKGSTYYLSPTKNGQMLTGLKTVKGNRYYFSGSGKLYRNVAGIKLKGKYYQINSKGVLKPLSTVAGMAGVRLQKQGGKLKDGFKWSAGLKYYPNSTRVPGNTTAAKYFGTYGFKYNKGDCNVQAYTFYWMAKLLGHKVRYVKGYVPQVGGTMGAHAWCEIVQNGKTYVYDPNFAATYGVDRGFKFTYGTKGTYRYFDKNKKQITKK